MGERQANNQITKSDGCRWRRTSYERGSGWRAKDQGRAFQGGDTETDTWAGEKGEISVCIGLGLSHIHLRPPLPHTERGAKQIQTKIVQLGNMGSCDISTGSKGRSGTKGR